jgi:small subunit ribosomal protein S8
MTDPIADLLTRIRNAQLVSKNDLSIPHSKIKEAIVKTLTDEGYLADYSVEDTKPQKTIHVTLKYIDDLPVITNIQRVSKSGRRVYVAAKDVTPVLSGHGIKILSTNQGVMTDKQARTEKIGGEVVCQVW